MKLTKVEIQAFRIYDELRNSTFDFEVGPGVPANFVSIYAPNGFGKTSFYDAVEWALTNKVGRINKSSFLKKDKAEERTDLTGKGRHVLRNRDSGDRPTFVKVHRSSGKEIHNYLSKNPAKNSTDIDLGARTGATGFEYFSQTLLEQERIAAFLRIEDAEERYREWARNLGNNDLSRYFQTIRHMLALNDERIDGIEKEKRDIEAVGFTGDEGVLVTLNDHIAAFRATGQDLPLVDEGYDQARWVRFINDLDGRIVDTTEAVKVARSAQKNIEAIIAGSGKRIGFEEYSVLSGKEKDLAVERDSLLKNQAILSSIAAVESRLADLTGEKVALAESIRNVSDLLEAFPEYARVRKRIEESEAKLASFGAELRELESSHQDLAGAAQNSDLLLEDLKKEAGVARALVEQYPSSKARLDALSEDRKLRIAERAALEKDFKSASEKELKPRRLLLQHVERATEAIEAANLKIRLDSIDPALRADLNEIKEGQRLDLENARELSEAQALLEEQQKFRTEVQQLVTVGLGVVRSTTAGECPLCQTPFDSHQDLLKRVEKNSFLSTESLHLADRVKEATSRKKRSASRLLSLTAELLGKLSTIKNRIGEELASDVQKTDAIRLAIDSAGEAISDLNDRIAAESSRFLGMDPAKYRSQIINNLKKMDVRIASDTEQLESARKRLAANRRRKAVVRENIKAIEKTLSGARRNKAYLSFVRDALKLGFEAPISKAKLAGRVAELKGSNLAVMNEIKKLDRDLKRDKARVPALKRKDIERGLSRVTAASKALQKQRSDFEVYAAKVLQQDIPQSGLTKKKLDEFLKDAGRQVKSANDLVLLLRKIEAMKESIRPFLAFWENQQKIKDLESQIDIKRQLRERLTEEKTAVSQRIREDVGRYFHQDLINRIYRAIDPHPLYKSIEFDCSFEDKLPTLDILVREEDGPGRIVPNLYFSAAQLNVLSLSIFLARALKATDDEKKPVECIFVDDPVQSMDSINILSTIDLLRSIIVNFKKQIILSTHDENFHNLLKRKIPTDRFGSKFIELETYGKIKQPASG